MTQDQAHSLVGGYPLLDALRLRRSRRFGIGMELNAGPLAFRSEAIPLRLSEHEEALLAFAACGATGPALGELVYSEGGGGTIMAGILGRTIASGDAIQTVSVFVINDDATFLLKRSRDFAPAQLNEISNLSRDGRYTDLYRQSRIKVKDGRAAPPLDLFYNLNVNRWSLYDPASTYFLPVNELTFLYINGLLEVLREENGAFIVDERAGFQPAGLKRFAKSRGGWLWDDPKAQRTMTIQQLETLVTEFVTIEQGMVMQNLGLMTQAMGLGGFPHWAAHPWGWLEALGFRMKQVPGTEYLGVGRLAGFIARLLRKETDVLVGLGLEVDGVSVLQPFCPPYHASMAAAVRAVVERKYGPNGVFRGGSAQGAWQEPQRIAQTSANLSEAVVDAAIALLRVRSCALWPLPGLSAALPHGPRLPGQPRRYRLLRPLLQARGAQRSPAESHQLVALARLRPGKPRIRNCPRYITPSTTIALCRGDQTLSRLRQAASVSKELRVPFRLPPRSRCPSLLPFATLRSWHGA